MIGDSLGQQALSVQPQIDSTPKNYDLVTPKMTAIALLLNLLLFGLGLAKISKKPTQPARFGLNSALAAPS